MQALEQRHGKQMPFLDFSGTQKEKRAGKSGSRRGSRESLDSVSYDAQAADEVSSPLPTPLRRGRSTAGLRGGFGCVSAAAPAECRPWALTRPVEAIEASRVPPRRVALIGSAVFGIVP